jgi:D-aminopeptidase
MDPAKPDSFAVGRASLIDDVNAVIGGLFDAGVTLVEVENTHGDGGDSLVPRDRLDKRATMMTGKRAHSAYVMGPATGEQTGFWNDVRPPYDAVVTVGMHDKPLSGGFSPHTIGMGISPIIDGRAVTETELVGYNFGTVGIPVIFASGDDRLRSTLASAMPWVEYAAVKRITAPTVAAPIATDEVRRALHDGAARAVRALAEPGRARVMRLPAEFRAGLLPSYPLLLPPGLGTLPGFQKHGDTVTFVAKDYRSAFWAIFALQRIGAAFSAERSFRELAKSPDSAVYRRAVDSMWTRAEAFEAGKWRP